MTPNFAAQKNDGNSYVPNMDFSHHIDINNELTVKIDNSVVDDTVLLASLTFVALVNQDVVLDIAEAFGRTVKLTSTDAGDMTLIGKDFLGQVMSETITCTAGTVAGKKAFKEITEMRPAADLAGDVIIKAGAEYGLPYCAVEIIREVVNGVASTEGTITAAVSTTPTATTGDTRGTYNPNTAGDGAKDISVTYVATSELLGGLYGQIQA